MFCHENQSVNVARYDRKLSSECFWKKDSKEEGDYTTLPAKPGQIEAHVAQLRAEQSPFKPNIKGLSHSSQL